MLQGRRDKYTKVFPLEKRQDAVPALRGRADNKVDESARQRKDLGDRDVLRNANTSAGDAADAPLRLVQRFGHCG